MESNVEKFRWFILLTGILTLIISILISPLLSDISYGIQAIPFLISMVFLGLPHGAMDHLVPAKLSQATIKKSIESVSLFYLLMGSLYAVLWFVTPVYSLIFFILMTWFHWGQGDIYVLKNFGFDFMTGSRIYSSVSLLLRGGIPMVVPLIAHPEKYNRFLSSILTEFSVKTSSLEYLLSTELSLILSGFIGILGIVNFISGLNMVENKSNLKMWLYDNFEITVLLVFFFYLPPLFAVGIYFCMWHSLRHIARLSLMEDDKMIKLIQAGGKLDYIKEISKNTFKLTLISLIILAISLFLFVDSVAIETLIAVYLVFISVLTLPHVFVVSWMDYKQMNMWKHFFYREKSN